MNLQFCLEKIYISRHCQAPKAFVNGRITKSLVLMDVTIESTYEHIKNLMKNSISLLYIYIFVSYIYTNISSIYSTLFHKTSLLFYKQKNPYGCESKSYCTNQGKSVNLLLLNYGCFHIFFSSIMKTNVSILVEILKIMVDFQVKNTKKKWKFEILVSNERQ